MKLLIKIQWVLSIAVMLLLGIDRTGLCQNMKPLPVKAVYSLKYSFEEKGGNSGVYKVVKEGNAKNNELLTWNITILDRSKNRVQRTLRMEIPYGSDRVPKTFPLNKGEILIEGFSGNEIIPQVITLPSMNDFDPIVRNGHGPILEGETVTLSVNPSRRFEQIDWVWSNGKKGETIQEELNRTTAFTVHGEYRGTSFRTKQKSVTVNLSRVADVLAFDLVGPVSPVPDTNAVTVSLNIRKNLFQNDLQWVWKDQRDKVLARNTNSITIQPDPIIDTELIRVCPSAGDRQFACKTFKIPLQRLSAPSDFTIRYPAKLYTDQYVTIRAESVTRDPRTKWTWTVDGRRMNTMADSIVLRPTPGIKVSVYPTLNRRGGVASQKQVSLGTVMVRTVLPSEIKGQMRLCGVPERAESYLLESAILGSESSYWVVMENGQEVARFKGNAFSLLIKKTSSYYLTTDKRFDLKLPFTVEVVDLPSEKLSIDGPSEFCLGQPFLLTLNGQRDENKMKWQWYRSDGENLAIRRPMGNGKTIRDSLQASSRYTLTAEFDGCPLSELPFHEVSVFKEPLAPKPQYTFLNNAHDRIKIDIGNNANRKNHYQWSRDQFSTVFADGYEISSYRLKKGTNTLYVRYKDECGLQSPQASISVTGKKGGYFFLNAGINGADMSRNRSYNLTIGSKSWYLRGKASLPFLLKDQFQNSLASTALQISDLSRVLNYPRSTDR